MNLYARTVNAEWWGRVFDEITSPEWVASAIQTLAGAGLALVVAIFVLRRQLRHDRDLARLQRLEDVKLAVAQRHAEVAGVIGRRAIDGAEALNTFDDHALVECLRTRDVWPWITDDIMPGLDDASAISRELTLLFAGGGQIHPFWNVWVRRLHEWHMLRATLLRLDRTQELGPTDSPSFEHAMYNAVDRRMIKTSVILRRVGESWVRWNGTDGLPDGTEILERHSFEQWPGYRQNNGWAAAETTRIVTEIREELAAAT